MKELAYFGNSRAVRNLVLKNKHQNRHMAPEGQHSKLSSDLHTYVHTQDHRETNVRDRDLSLP